MQDEYIRIIIDIPKDTYEYVLEGAETSHDEVMVMDAIRNSNLIDTNNELHNTIYGMISDDYKARLKAEYKQVVKRFDNLTDMLQKYKNNELNFTLTCPIYILEEQSEYMAKYADILAYRAMIEGINLD